MKTVAGVIFENDTNGHHRYVKIDMRKYGKIIQPFLEQIGVKEEEEDEFDRDWKRAITGDEVRKAVHEHIELLFSQTKK